MVDAGEITTVFRNISLSHPNGTDEIDLVEHFLLTEKDTHYLDFSNFGNEVTIRVFRRSDGVNYEQVSQRIFPTEYELDTKIVTIILDGAAQDMKITLQSSTMEGQATSILGTVRDELRNE